MGEFRSILADPPWSYLTRGGGCRVPQRAAVQHYDTMSAESLATLDVRALADPRGCLLYMWVVDSHFDQAFELGHAWGFTFRTIAFVWDKGVMGLGHWTRKEAELCLLFGRGRPKRLHADVRQIIREPAREHSRKPDEQYRRIERLSRGPYLELFARASWPNWTAWGNDTQRFNPLATPSE